MQSFNLLLACLMAFAFVVNAAPYMSPAERHPISPELFKTFVRYTLFTSAGIDPRCPNAPFDSEVVSYINQTTSDTQATIFRDDAHKEFILAFPGTASKQDAKTDFAVKLVPYISPGILDLDCVGCLAHMGWLGAWNSVAPSIHEILTTGLAKYDDYKVVVVGHSLGAALAQFAYSSLKGLKLPVRAGYTTGQPRVGNKAFADHIDKLSGASPEIAGDYHRITHSFDRVPQFPPEVIGYRHPLTEYWESGENKQKASTTYRCFGQEPAHCNKGHQDIKKAIKDNDHALYTNTWLGDGDACNGAQ